MNKIKVSKKQMKDATNKLIAVGYCDMQYLLYYENAFAYSAGTNGWCCDYYNINDIIISTGYAPIGNVRIDHETTQKYENIARNIVNDYNLTYDHKKNQVKSLLCELIKSTIKE